MFKYPLSKQNKKIDPKFQSKWLDEDSLLFNSIIKMGALCKLCTIFS